MIAPLKPAFRLVYQNQRGGWAIADAGGIVGNYDSEAEAARVAAFDCAHVVPLTFERLVALANWYLHEADAVTIAHGRPDLLAWVAWAFEVTELANTFRPAACAADSLRRFSSQLNSVPA